MTSGEPHHARSRKKERCLIDIGELTLSLWTLRFFMSCADLNTAIVMTMIFEELDQHEDPKLSNNVNESEYERDANLPFWAVRSQQPCQWRSLGIILSPIRQLYQQQT